MRRKQNMIIFSAGESVKNGTVAYIEEQLCCNGILCYDYRSLFKNAHDAENISLLPNLSKKIPTFDFALILAEGVDKMILRGDTEQSTMRDNVLFELGLCIMGLGADRVILLAEESVRIPDDLSSFGKIGVEYITFKMPDMGNAIEKVSKTIENKTMQFKVEFTTQIEEIIEHINTNAEIISPVFIGAAVSSAEAYFLNFIIRLLENLDKKYSLKQGNNRQFVFPENISIKIIIPKKVTSSMKDAIQEYYIKNACKEYVINDAGFRGLFFNGILDETNNSLTIIDIPTSITASYSIVNSVLNIDSDEDYDMLAEERFVDKEIDVYAFALSKLLSSQTACERLSFIEETEKKERIMSKLSKVSIEVLDIIC